MKIQTHQLVIPAKAGTQEKVEKKSPFHINWEKIVLFQPPDWVPAFAGMTNWGNINAYITSNLRILRNGKMTTGVAPMRISCIEWLYVNGLNKTITVPTSQQIFIG